VNQNSNNRSLFFLFVFLSVNLRDIIANINLNTQGEKEEGGDAAAGGEKKKKEKGGGIAARKETVKVKERVIIARIQRQKRKFVTAVQVRSVPLLHTNTHFFQLLAETPH